MFPEYKNTEFTVVTEKVMGIAFKDLQNVDVATVGSYLFTSYKKAEFTVDAEKK